MIRKTKNSLIACCVLLMLVGCTTQPGNQKSEDRTVKLVYTDWSEAVAITNLAKILLEEQMDIEVEAKLTDVEEAYAEVASGKSDVFADAWLPETHRNYLETYTGKIEMLSIIYPHARTGLVVPDYSQYQSINDLNGSSVSIIGIDSGAGIMAQARHAIEQYELEGVELKDLSEQEMTDQFSESFKRREEIIITGWEPHWLFDRFEVRFLNDPRSVFGIQENIYAIGTSGLEERLPHVVRFFERMQLSEQQINSLIYYMNSEADPEDGVREWMHKNEYIVNQWVKDLKPERKKIM